MKDEELGKMARNIIGQGATWLQRLNEQINPATPEEPNQSDGGENPSLTNSDGNESDGSETPEAETPLETPSAQEPENKAEVEPPTKPERKPFLGRNRSQ